ARLPPRPEFRPDFTKPIRAKSMATLENLPTHEAFREELANLSDYELMAQEIVQKGAIHALDYLLREGCTEKNCRDMLRSARSNAETISELVRLRNLPVVDFVEHEQSA